MSDGNIDRTSLQTINEMENFRSRFSCNNSTVPQGKNSARQVLEEELSDTHDTISLRQSENLSTLHGSSGPPPTLIVLPTIAKDKSCQEQGFSH